MEPATTRERVRWGSFDGGRLPLCGPKFVVPVTINVTKVSRTLAADSVVVWLIGTGQHARSVRGTETVDSFVVVVLPGSGPF